MKTVLTNPPTASIIIRARNEGKYLDQVLAMLANQTFKDFEIIVVNNDSTDTTLAIAQKYHCSIVNLAKNKFTYPYACNLGVKHSLGKYLVFLSGHSIPISTDWLKDGLVNFKDPKVAGVYATALPLPNAYFFEKLTYTLISKLFRGKRFVMRNVNRAKMGTLGFTNAIIRKDLWEKYPLNENFGAGGEDGDWARHWLGQGMIIVHDPKFKVYHSHNLKLVDLIKQYQGWLKMARENNFVAQKRNF